VLADLIVPHDISPRQVFSPQKGTKVIKEMYSVQP
jgi:hypothetical protein